MEAAKKGRLEGTKGRSRQLQEEVFTMRLDEYDLFRPVIASPVICMHSTRLKSLDRHLRLTHCARLHIIVAQHSVPVSISIATTTLEPSMTSFMVEAHVDRHIHPEWADNPQCAFCLILRNQLPAHILYEDDKVIAILGRSLCNVMFRPER